MLKVVHYINQFFANVGGEEMAHIPALLTLLLTDKIGLSTAEAGVFVTMSTAVFVP
ncbi:glycine/sarcosine/betaine reductase selenoprotein B family protein, partial [Sedimentibacter saalensis]|uniref:glycine/sarcosine/betaine reductase selenoprotein B family protein n=1 Tax=Sedimentibacter saalensis TaxID=130788 RepID=UPI00396A4FEF